MSVERRGGVLLAINGVPRFLPASLAVAIAPLPRLTPVIGAPPQLLGIALHRGAVIPVIEIGSERGEMVVCQHAGELIGLVGGRVLKSGSFRVPAEQSEKVEHEGNAVAPLDVTSLYEGLLSAPRALRQV